MDKAEYWIEKLGLIKHPEGGYFKETYRSEEFIKRESLPVRFSGDRCFSTSIYFLLTKEEFSAFHRIKSDEIWHHYTGGTIELHIIDADGIYKKVLLGKKIDNDECLQIVVPKESWFASKVIGQEDFALVGCTVSPGFDFNDFELASKKELLEKYPSQIDIIEEFSIK